MSIAGVIAAGSELVLSTRPDQVLVARLLATRYALSITTLVPTFAETIIVGEVHPAGRRLVRRAPGDDPQRASRPQLHSLTTFSFHSVLGWISHPNRK